MTSRWLARGILLLMGMSWGLSFSLAKVAAMGGVHPLSLAFWEAFVAGGILLAMCLVRRRPIPVSGELSLLYLVAGVVGMAAPAIGFFYAAAHVPAGVLSISLAIVPILTFLVSAGLGLETVAPGRVLGVLLGVVAIMLLVGPDQSLPDPAQFYWVLVGVLAAASYGSLNIIMARWKPRGATSFTSAAGMFAAASIIMVPILGLTGTFVPFAWPWTDVEWAIVGLGVINAVGYTLYFYLIEHAGPVFTSQTANLVTLFGVLWGIVIFGEQNSMWVWLSLATMMLAIALVVPRTKPVPAI
jgi:drug/metabolite transporter (DMT)-like permease